MVFRSAKLLGVIVLAAALSALADGKFLRGEKWQKFDSKGKTADFYVAVNGNDAWSGTLAEPNAAKTDGPFATIARSMQAVRELKSRVYKPKVAPIEKRFIGSPHPFGEGKDILVYVRNGYYPLTKPLQFEPADGGERVQTNLPTGAFEFHQLKDHFVTYAAYPGEKPVLVGGQVVKNWQKKENGWTSKLDLAGADRFVANGIMQPLARTPNTGYYTPAVHPTSKTSFAYRSGDVEPWPDMENNRIIMLLRWHTGHNSIERVDPARHTVYLKKEQPGMIVVPPRYYIENVKALMDSPGEWYFDSKTGELSFIPPTGVTDPNTLFGVVPTLDQLLVVKGMREKPVRNLRFYGLGFEAVTPGKEAVSFEYGHDCELVDCTLNALGGRGVYFGLGNYQSRIMSNIFTNITDNAIVVQGAAHPEHWMDIVRETVVSHNRIDNAGGSTIGAHNSLNTIISHNEVTNNHGRTGISVGGWQNHEEAIDGGYRVEYNHVHHVQSQADDSGAITSAGLSYDSVIRNNLIHDVKAGYFNNNVAVWFDNMSSGWSAENNIYYNLGQDEMKLCAANLVDNLYGDNYLIEAPLNAPEPIIDGTPAFTCSDLQVQSLTTGLSHSFVAGEEIQVTAMVTNRGATGLDRVDLYGDGKVVAGQTFPVIANNTRRIRFITHFVEPGKHEVAIGDTPYTEIDVTGTRPPARFDSLRLSAAHLPAGESLTITVRAQNLQKSTNEVVAPLYVNNRVVDTQTLQLAYGATAVIQFSRIMQAGVYDLRVGHSTPTRLDVYPHASVPITAATLSQYCSATAKPCEFEVDPKNKRYVLQASGTDFMHGEDSYGTVYLKKPIKGNFVATVKLDRFGANTNPWFRAGLYIRNDMTKSYDTGDASLGSVLWFVTTGRVGMNWDRFGDGAMHAAGSQNHATLEPYPMWLKLVRDGDRLFGYLSYDGKNWTVSRSTDQVKGLAPAVHIGLAAGSCDEISYTVEFSDFKVEAEKEGWKK